VIGHYNHNSDHLSSLCPITNTRDKYLTKYDNYMMIGDLNYDLLCPITNTRDKCLTKYDNYMMIGDLLVIGHYNHNSDHLSSCNCHIESDICHEYW
jgi:hypothetical protein